MRRWSTIQRRSRQVAGSDTIHRSRLRAQPLDVLVGRPQVGLEDRQPQPLLRQPPGELRQSASPQESDNDAVTHNQEIASPQHQRQHEPMRGRQADQRHHAEHRQARHEHGNHEEGQAGHGQTEEGRSLDEREESGAAVADATRCVGRLSPPSPLHPLRIDFPRRDTPVCPTRHRGGSRAEHPREVYLGPPLRRRLAVFPGDDPTPHDGGTELPRRREPGTRSVDLMEGRMSQTTDTARDHLTQRRSARHARNGGAA